ncbi:MAG: Flp family type IVb pilin [Deltaproteobacteria bacterium]
MKKFISKIAKSESGQGMVEYGLIIAVIAIVVLVALTPVGTSLSQVFGRITTAISGV